MDEGTNKDDENKEREERVSGYLYITYPSSREARWMINSNHLH